jgi:hypothetical protein
MLATVLAGVGHWLIWMCCIPVFTFADDEIGQTFFDFTEWVARIQVGLTPPLALGWYLPFRMEEYADPNSGRNAYELVLGGIGIVFWAVAALLLWMAIADRFRVLSGRLPFLPAGRGTSANGPAVDAVLADSPGAAGGSLPAVNATPGGLSK